jgi:hypothetical protein
MNYKLYIDELEDLIFAGTFFLMSLIILNTDRISYFSLFIGIVSFLLSGWFSYFFIIERNHRLDEVSKWLILLKKGVEYALVVLTPLFN